MSVNDAESPNRADRFEPVLRWLSAVINPRLLAIILVVAIAVILGSAAVVSVKLASTRIYAEALEVQSGQLKNLQAMFELHETMQQLNTSLVEIQAKELKAYADQLADHVVVPDLELFDRYDQ